MKEIDILNSIRKNSEGAIAYISNEIEKENEEALKGHLPSAAYNKEIDQDPKEIRTLEITNSAITNNEHNNSDELEQPSLNQLLHIS